MNVDLENQFTVSELGAKFGELLATLFAENITLKKRVDRLELELERLEKDAKKGPLTEGA